MNLVYHPECPTSGSLDLDHADSTHLAKVLRMKEGALVHVTNGKGGLFEGVIATHGKQMGLEIQKSIPVNQPPSLLEMVVAPTKNQDRLEWFIEKAVEIGVGKIRLITTEHSERTHIRLERLERVAIAAMKQSLKFFLPEILEPVLFQKWLPTVHDQVCIAHCRDFPQRKLLRDVLVPGSPSTIAIGPEGDFSVAELQMAVEAGCIPVSLGQARLRTETAAMCAVHTFELINQKA